MQPLDFEPRFKVYRGPMAEIAISELARASGFSSSALRYYERVGLLQPVGRTPAGYRLYDEDAVERLAFIGRAKRMGLHLDDIADLVALWQDGPCSPVQTRLQSLLDDKVTTLQSQIHELGRFRTQLEHVQRSLAETEPADHCGPGCGCDTELSEVDAPSTVACSLEAEGQAARLEEWRALLDLVEERRPSAGGIRLRFPRDSSILGAVTSLTVRELECCSFFTFTLALDAQEAWLEVGAPPDARSMLTELFGPFDA